MPLESLLSIFDDCFVSYDRIFLDVKQMPYDGFGDGVCVFAKYPLATIPS